MNDGHAAQVLRNAGSGRAAPGLAGLLAFAGTPVFAAMALWSGLAEGQPDVLCSALHAGSPLHSMGVMYGLMSVFHAGPWLRLIQHECITPA